MQRAVLEMGVLESTRSIDLLSRILTPRSLAGLLAGVFFLGAATPPAIASTTSAPSATLAAMERVADWQLAHPTGYPADDWTEGVGDAGFMALAGISGSAKYRDAMVLMGTRNGWRLGRRVQHADDQVVGQTYVELYQMLRDPRMIASMRAQFDGILRHRATARWTFWRATRKCAGPGAMPCSWRRLPGLAWPS